MIVIEKLEANLENAERLFEFVLPLAREVAQAPVDVERCFGNFCSTLDQGHTFVAWDGDEIVGSLGLLKTPYWYGSEDSCFLLDRWCYVRPDRRYGDVGIKLLRAGRDEGRRLGLNVFVVVANPDRRPKQNEAAVYSVIAGFSPFTHVMHLYKAPVAGSA